MDSQISLHVSTDSVVFGLNKENLCVLLIREEIDHPDIQSDTWKLPGGIIQRAEDPDKYMDQILKKILGLKDLKKYHLKGLSTSVQSYSETDSSDLNSQRLVISIPYYSVVNICEDSTLNQNAHWIPLEKVKYLHIIAVHHDILERALKTLRNELQTSPIVFEFLPVKFTLGHLQKIYELIFMAKIDKRNFRKKISKIDYIIPLKDKETSVSHRPARLYMFSWDMYKKLHLGKNKLLSNVKFS